MGAALSRGQLLPNSAAVGDEANAVARIKRYLRKAESGIDGVIKLAELANAGAHQAAAVEDDPDHLAALDLVEARHKVTAAGGGGPADIAVLVAELILAQALELAANASHAGMALLHCNLAAAQ